MSCRVDGLAGGQLELHLGGGAFPVPGLAGEAKETGRPEELCIRDQCDRSQTQAIILLCHLWNPELRGLLRQSPQIDAQISFTSVSRFGKPSMNLA